MFRAPSSAVGVFLCVVAGSRPNTHKNVPIAVHTILTMRKKCSKHVEAINRNKLKVNRASCWSYHTDTLPWMVNNIKTKNQMIGKGLVAFAPVASVLKHRYSTEIEFLYARTCEGI
jgi:hypothetical protein